MHEPCRQLFEMAVDRLVFAESEVARLQALVTKYEHDRYLKTTLADEVVVRSRLVKLI
jgi:hypothetical protein